MSSARAASSGELSISLASGPEGFKDGPDLSLSES